MMKKFVPIALLSATLSACGLSEQINNDIQAAKEVYATLSLLIRDAQSLQHPEIWITLHRVELIDGDDQAVEVYANSNGRVFNLASKSDVAELLDAQRIPAGNYKTLRVTLGNEVVWVDLSGKRETRTLGSSDTIVVDIPADIQAIENKISALAIDFNINSLLNGSTPAIGLISDVNTQIKRTYADLRGTVIAIDRANNSLDIRLGDNGPIIQVDLHPSAVITDEQAQQVLTSLDSLNINDIVDLFGNIDPSKLRIEAISLIVNGSTVSTGAAEQVISKVVKLEGLVQSVADNAMDVDVTEASFVPPENIITVVDITNALYGRGNTTMLIAGAEVEVKGTWDGTQVTAGYIEVEGAPAATELTQDERLAELEGTVTSFNNGVLSLTVEDYENFTPGSDPFSFELGDAWFKEGNPACLIAGAEVEIKGFSQQTAPSSFTATVIEVDDCDTYPSEDDDDSEDKSMNHAPGGDDDSSDDRGDSGSRDDDDDGQARGHGSDDDDGSDDDHRDSGSRGDDDDGQARGHGSNDDDGSDDDHRDSGSRGDDDDGQAHGHSSDDDDGSDDDSRDDDDADDHDSRDGDNQDDEQADND